MSELSVAVGSADFEFYAKFAKSLILTLKRTEDRILASAWFSKLRDMGSGPDKLRLDYLKLLLFVLQRHRLAGPFTENPHIREELQAFGENYDLATVAKQIIESEQREKRERYMKRIRGETGDFTPFSTDHSPDLREYVAAQDIPNFGVHVFYAISKDPILDWDNAQHAVFPKMVRRMEPQGHLSETSFAVIEPKPEPPDQSATCKILEETGVMPDESLFLTRRTRQRRSPFDEVQRPAPLLGTVPGEDEAIEQEELPAPTWGSNLIEVREPLDLEGPEPTPSEAALEIATAVPTGDIMEGADIGLELPQAEHAARVEHKAPEDEEIAKLLEESFNMEDIMAEVDAIEMEDDDLTAGGDIEVDPLILAEEEKFREMEEHLNKHDAALDLAIAELDEDERRMLMELEAGEEEAEEAPVPVPPSPKKEVKVVADDDTVIKVLVEAPEAVVETVEEKKRKHEKAAADKKKKPAGRTGLNKGKAKGAILKPSEKKELEKEEKKAKVVTTKTGAAGVSKSAVKKTGGAKPTTSKTGIKAPSKAGIPTPGAKGVPRPGGTGISRPGSAGAPRPSGTTIPQPAGTGIPKPGGTGIPRPGGTGIPKAGGMGIPKPKGTGIPKPGGTGIPQPGRSGIPAPGGRGIPRPSAATQAIKTMQTKVTKMLDDTRAEFPERFDTPEEAARAATQQQQGPPGESRRLSPIEEMSMAPLSPGSPEADDIFDEMEREYQILERLYELYEQLAPDQQEGLRTPPLFSKHPEIKKLGRQLRYRGDEFGLDPWEEFAPATQFFARPEQAKQGAWYDPRYLFYAGLSKDVPPDLIGKAGPTPRPPEVHVTKSSPAQAISEEPPPALESPPWTGIEELKRIAERADKRAETSPAITSGMAVTTPKSPATPKRLARRNLMEDFTSASPPLYDSPEIFSPPPVETPEFIRIKSYGLPDIVTQEELDRRYQERLPGYEAYIQAEIEAEKQKWAYLQGPPPELPYRRPASRQPPPPHTPPSTGKTPGTPARLPAQYQMQYETPPHLRRQPLQEMPPEPEVVPYDYEQHDILYQKAPELVDAEFDEFELVDDELPDFQLEEWTDPLKQIAEAAPYDIGLDMPPDLMSPELEPFEDEMYFEPSPQVPSAPLSPLDTLKQRVEEHEIPEEFRQYDRPDALSKRVFVGKKMIRIPRRPGPTPLAAQAIQEDLSGEEFEEIDTLIREEEDKFLDMIVTDEGRVERLKQLVENAQLLGEVGLEDEELPEDFIEFDEEGLDLGPDGEPIPPPSPFRSPIRTPERPVKPVVTPPPPPTKGQLLWRATPERREERDLFMEEADFLASPGLPTPPEPSPEPQKPVSPPPTELRFDDMLWASPSELSMLEEEDILLASPGLPTGRTVEDDFRELGSPIKLSPPKWERAKAPQPPPAPPPEPTPPREVMFESPEIDRATFRRKLGGHEVSFPKAGEGGFRAGRRWVGRRTARNYGLIPIAERLDYDMSKKLPTERDHRVIRSKLPPLPPAETIYPSELMGEAHPVPFQYAESLIDEPFYEEEQDLPPALKPEWQLMGWETPPRLKTRPLHELLRRSPKEPEPEPYVKASHYRDVLTFQDAPEGIFLPEDDDEEDFIPPIMMMGEHLFSPPQRQMPVPSPPRPSPPRPSPIPHRMSPPPQMAYLQVPPIGSPPSAPPAPEPHWSPQPGPSWMPHRFPYAPPSPPPEQSYISPPSPPQMIQPPSPDRFRAPTSPPPPCAPTAEPSPKILKRSKEISFTSEVFDPDSPEESRKWTRGKTILEFNRPEGDQRPVVSPPSQGVAVYARGPPESRIQFSPAGMPDMQLSRPQRRPRRRQRMPRGPAPSDSPKAQRGGMLPRRMLFQEEGVPRRRLIREFRDEPPEQPISLSRVRVCPGTLTGEKVFIVEDFEEVEDDFIPEHLQGFKWMDEPDESFGKFMY